MCIGQDVLALQIWQTGWTLVLFKLTLLNKPPLTWAWNEHSSLVFFFQQEQTRNDKNICYQELLGDVQRTHSRKSTGIGPALLSCRSIMKFIYRLYIQQKGNDKNPPQNTNCWCQCCQLFFQICKLGKDDHQGQSNTCMAIQNTGSTEYCTQASMKCIMI